MSRTFKSKSYRGMTLVELLVVVAIMLMLVAIGIPMLRPMLEKQGQSQGAQVLRVMLLRTRNLAIDKKIPCALRLERFNDVNSGDTEAVVRLSVVREEPDTVFSSAELGNLWVELNGSVVPTFILRGSSGDTTFPIPPAPPAAPAEKEAYDAFNQNDQGVTDGTRIQFWGTGPVYRVKYVPDFRPDTAADPNPNDDDPDIRFINEEIEEINPADAELQNLRFSPFSVVKDGTVGDNPKWIPTSIPSVLMPEGICVDLWYSGNDACEFGYSIIKPTPPLPLPPSCLHPNNYAGDLQCLATEPECDSVFPTTGDVFIWFRADGTFERVVYYDSNSTQKSKKCDGLVHFLIGLWEQTRTVRKGLSEDPRTNLEMPSSIWVSLDPRSSRILINENKVPDDPNGFKEARKFANELWKEFAAPR